MVQDVGVQLVYVVGIEEKTLEMRLERWSSRAKDFGLCSPLNRRL